MLLRTLRLNFALFAVYFLPQGTLRISQRSLLFKCNIYFLTTSDFKSFLNKVGNPDKIINPTCSNNP